MCTELSVVLVEAIGNFVRLYMALSYRANLLRITRFITHYALFIIYFIVSIYAVSTARISLSRQQNLRTRGHSAPIIQNLLLPLPALPLPRSLDHILISYTSIGPLPSPTATRRRCWFPPSVHPASSRTIHPPHALPRISRAKDRASGLLRRRQRREHIQPRRPLSRGLRCRTGPRTAGRRRGHDL